MIEIESMGWVLSLDPSAILAPGMFLALILALLSGFPVAFCLGGIGVIFALLGMLSGEIEPQFVTALPQRILGIMGNFTLLAIPAFVFMGSMLESLVAPSGAICAEAISVLCFNFTVFCQNFRRLKM